MKYTIWNSLVWCSAFVLFVQMIVNGMLHFKFYWVMNLFIIIALYHLMAVRFSGADIVKGFNRKEEGKPRELKFLCGIVMVDGKNHLYICTKQKNHTGSHEAMDSNGQVIAIWGKDDMQDMQQKK